VAQGEGLELKPQYHKKKNWPKESDKVRKLIKLRMKKG
jgi:hypothetical protein